MTHDRKKPTKTHMKNKRQCLVKCHFIAVIKYTQFSQKLFFDNVVQITDQPYIGCAFKFILKVGVEESIVNAPLHSENTTQKVRLDLSS
jgi:hypothetical protein